MTATQARRRAAALTSTARGQAPLGRTLGLSDDAAHRLSALPAALLVVLVVFGPAALVLAVAGLCAGALALRRTAARRRTVAAERALPGVLESVARQLRAGSGLAQAITTTRPPPTAGDLVASWLRLADLVPIVGVSAALDEWMSSEDTTRPLHLAAGALSLATTTGGSAARAIDGVAATLRSRLAVGEEIRALSSQARASATVIAAAPLVFGAFAGLTDARTRRFLGTPLGLTLVAAGLSLDALGGWWMSRLCRPAEP